MSFCDYPAYPCEMPGSGLLGMHTHVAASSAAAHHAMALCSLVLHIMCYDCRASITCCLACKEHSKLPGFTC